MNETTWILTVIAFLNVFTFPIIIKQTKEIIKLKKELNDYKYKEYWRIRR